MNSNYLLLIFLIWFANLDDYFGLWRPKEWYFLMIPIPKQVVVAINSICLIALRNDFIMLYFIFDKNPDIPSIIKIAAIKNFNA